MVCVGGKAFASSSRFLRFLPPLRPNGFISDAVWEIIVINDKYKNPSTSTTVKVGFLCQLVCRRHRKVPLVVKRVDSQYAVVGRGVLRVLVFAQSAFTKEQSCTDILFVMRGSSGAASRVSASAKLETLRSRKNAKRCHHAPATAYISFQIQNTFGTLSRTLIALSHPRERIHTLVAAE